MGEGQWAKVSKYDPASSLHLLDSELAGIWGTLFSLGKRCIFTQLLQDEFLLLQGRTRQLLRASVSTEVGQLAFPDNLNALGTTTICSHTDEFFLIWTTSKGKTRSRQCSSTWPWHTSLWNGGNIKTFMPSLEYPCLVGFPNKTCPLIYSLWYCTFSPDHQIACDKYFKYCLLKYETKKPNNNKPKKTKVACFLMQRK